MAGARGPGDGGGLTVPSPEADDLVARAIEGDGEAFAALFRASVSTVYQTVFGRSGDRALAEDCTSEAYLRAMRSLHRFEGDSRDFLAWVVRIARNAFLDHVKSARVRWEQVTWEMPPVQADSDPESEALGRVDAHHLRRALGQLTEDQQEVLYLRFMQGLPIAEVAAILDRNVGAVKALQFRALRSLQRVLESRGLLEDETT